MSTPLPAADAAPVSGRRAVLVLAATILGSAIAFIDTSVASLLPGGAVGALGYAQQIYMLPISLFAVRAVSRAGIASTPMTWLTKMPIPAQTTVHPSTNRSPKIWPASRAGRVE